jgi:hypothetical protein
MKNERNFEF